MRTDGTLRPIDDKGTYVDEEADEHEYPASNKGTEPSEPSDFFVGADEYDLRRSSHHRCYTGEGRIIVNMRLDKNMVERVDAYARKHGPTRTAAMNVLLNTALPPPG
jgi:hypothetical protein